MCGGCERVIQHLMVYALKERYECKLILIDNKPIHYDIPSECEILTVGQKSDNSLIDKVMRYLQVRRLVKEYQPDIVLSMPEEIGIYVICSLFGTGIPVVVSERNNPWVMPYKKITRFLRMCVYPFADGYIFQTKHAASFFSKKIQDKGIVLPNPLDLTRLPEPYKGIKDKIVVGVGRLEEQKNFKLLIDAFSVFYLKNNDYRLVIYGEGKLREELIAYAKTKLPDAVFSFPGCVSNLPEHIARASMFVLSSNFEGMPNALIEAMALGIPSIATDCPSGGPAELIENKVNGYLVPMNDIKQLAMIMSEIKNNTIEINTQLGIESSKIRERLDSDIVCEKWMKYLEMCIR